MKLSINNSNLLFAVVIIPYFLSYIMPIFFIGTIFNEFEIGDAYLRLKKNDIIEIIPIIIIGFLSFFPILYFQKKSNFNEGVKGNISIKLIYFLILFSLLGLLNNFIDKFLILINFKQVLIQLSYMPIISLIFISKFHNTKKFYYLFLVIVIFDMIFNFILTSITRDILIKVLILLVFVKHERINLKNSSIFLIFLIFLFLSKDFLRNNQLINFKTISIYDYKLDKEQAIKINRLINTDNPNHSGKFILQKTKHLNLFKKYENYFDRMKINKVYEDSDDLSLCDVEDTNCLTFKEFYKRLINLSINENNEDNKYSLIRPIQRFDKVSNLIYYNKKTGSNFEYLGLELYYPQILSVIPIPRFIWKKKPVQINGFIIGNHFLFNTSKSGFNAWYEPLIIELFISLGYVGLLIFFFINSLTIFYIYKLRNSINFNINNLILTIGLIKFYLDYQVQGFVESFGGYLYFLFTLLIVSFFLKKAIKLNWLRG